MNKQQFFDKGVVGIIQQGGPAIGGSVLRCRYRTGQGNKCAVGHNIPDENYRSSFEGVAPYGAPKLNVVAKACGCENEADALFARRFQRTHDSAAMGGTNFMVQFIANVREFAANNDLNTEALDAALAQRS